MESNGNEELYNRNTGQEFDRLPRKSKTNASPLQGQESYSTASEVMNLASLITKTSADIYDMIADVAECMQESSDYHAPKVKPDGQLLPAALLDIVDTTRATDMRLRRLEVQTITECPEILDRFLEDCWAASVTFHGVFRRLAEIIGLDGWENPSTTASATLGEIMEQLRNCSEKVSSLPGTGMAVSSRCLIHTAIHLQRQAGKLAAQATGPS